MKKALSVILSVLLIISVLPFAFAAECETVILYTNDVHSAIDNYPELAAYRAELMSQGKNVILVDAGDAVQGELIGMLTKGEAVVDIMNAVGYDYAVPGNHEFDYGVDVFLELAKNKAQYDYISSNFHKLSSADSVFEPYAIENFGDYQIAFVGISTPESISESAIDYFKDKYGNFSYGFPTFPGNMTDEILYENIQESIDDAISDGADIVIAVGHTGIIGTTEGWKSTDIIANTDGIDFYIDAHSHETTEGAVYKNKNGEDVILSSAGTKLENFGVLTISGGTVESELVDVSSIDVEAMSQQAKTAYADVKAKVDGYNEELAYYYEEIGYSEVKLVAYDDDDSFAVRKRETNAGDFVADAYRDVTGADIAVANGGGIRADIEEGAVTRKMLMDMNPFGNEMCVIKITGQQLIDVLEYSAHSYPDESGSFLQVSGVSFEIYADRTSPVICDDLDNFVYIAPGMERRVENVYVSGEPVDLGETYTLTGSKQVIASDGEGFTMLQGSEIVQTEALPCDYEMLIKYFEEALNGNISAEMYGNADGDGRITIIEAENNPPDYDYEIKYGEKKTVTASAEKETFVKFVPEESGKYVFRTESDSVDTGAHLFDAHGNELFSEYDDDADGTLNFRLIYECVAGEEYYLQVYTYSGDTESFELVVECGHIFENSACVLCGEICSHTEIAFLGLCRCGEKFIGSDISSGDEYELSEPSAADFWFRFIPDVSGAYSFKSVSDGKLTDPDCNLYDAAGEYIVSSYDINEMDFDLICNFEAGETYYFQVYDNYGEQTYKVVLAAVNHTAEDGSTHDVEFVEGTYSNCTEHGYTDGLYCAICDKFVSGHEKKELDKDAHIDEDWNEICDRCDKEIVYEDDEETDCEHICHTENKLLGFIWKLLKFIYRLLSLKPVCECGAAHY